MGHKTGALQNIGRLYLGTVNSYSYADILIKILLSIEIAFPTELTDCGQCFLIPTAILYHMTLVSSIVLANFENSNGATDCYIHTREKPWYEQNYCDHVQ